MYMLLLYIDVTVTIRHNLIKNGPINTAAVEKKYYILVWYTTFYVGHAAATKKQIHKNKFKHFKQAQTP